MRHHAENAPRRIANACDIRIGTVGVARIFSRRIAEDNLPIRFHLRQHPRWRSKSALSVRNWEIDTRFDAFRKDARALLRLQCYPAALESGGGIHR